MALACACAQEPTTDLALVEWEKALVDYATACATGKLSLSLRLRAALTDGPVLICSGRSTPTVEDGKNAAFAIRYARELGREDVEQEATRRLVVFTEELRAGSRGWLPDDMAR